MRNIRDGLAHRRHGAPYAAKIPQIECILRRPASKAMLRHALPSYGIMEKEPFETPAQQQYHTKTALSANRSEAPLVLDARAVCINYREHA